MNNLELEIFRNKSKWDSAEVEKYGCKVLGTFLYVTKV